jgi:hypothetical protein
VTNRAYPARLDQIARRSGKPLEHVLEIWNERAAIREFEGGMTRRDAERAAVDDAALEAMRKHNQAQK